MSVLGELALAFLVDSVLLAAFWAAVALAGAALVVPITGGSLRPAGLRGPAIAGFLAAMTAASLAHRFGAPDVILGIGRRQVPLLWSVGAGIAGAAVYALIRRRSTPAAA